MKEIKCVLILLCSFLTLQGQNIDTELLKGIEIRNIGPAGMSGRVTSIDVVRQQPAHIFIGTASGGVWESKNGGINWDPIFDEQPTLAVGAVCIDQSNPDIIWVGTGEGNPRNSHNSGAGVFKSIDGGKTWSYLGLKETRLIHRIIIDPQNSDRVYVGALGSAWGDSQDRGVFRTEDGGKTWEKILYVNPSTGVADMVMDPSNPEKLLVAMWDFRRTPWTFTSGGKGSGLYRSYNGGDDWTQITSEDGLPKGELGRMGLAFATNEPERVYALIEAKKNGFYKSDDGGHSWELVASKNIGNRPFYYADIYVDPKNENRIFNLWSYVSLSEDGGKSFTNIMDYANRIHPDHHALYIHPDNPHYIINGNDGGLNISYDGGKTWKFSGNIPLGQFYHIDVDTAFPYNIYGGLQDNGSWVGPSSVLKRGGIRNDDWQELYFGDGFDVLPRPDNNRFGYAMSQGGNLAYYDRETGRTQLIKPVHPEGHQLRYNWNAPVAKHPTQACGVYYGSQYVHYSDDCGQSWSIISPDLTTNDSLKQKQHESGGLTLDVTQAENHTTLLCIAPDMQNDQIIWTGSDDGLVHLTRDGGQSWERVSDRIPGLPGGCWIPQISVGSQEGEAFIVVNNYRQNDWRPFLYHTEDFGQSFTRLVGEEDVAGFVVSVVQDAVEPNLLFLGTDVGLYFSLDRGTTWLKWYKNLPNMQIRDLKIQSKTSDLVIGTFGRAIWILDDISFLRTLASGSKDLEASDFTMLHCSDANLMFIASYKGVRFYAQGEFSGANDRLGAVAITYFIKKSEEKPDLEKEDVKQKKKRQKDEIERPSEDSVRTTVKKDPPKASFYIVNSNGDTIRTFRSKLKEGINRLYWPLNEDGVVSPSRREHRTDGDRPGGMKVLPGRYLIIGVLGDWKDSSWVKVGPDPRVDFSLEAAQTKRAAIREYYQFVETVTLAVEQLKESEKTIKAIEATWHHLPDTTQKELKKLAKNELMKIDSLLTEFVGPKEIKGILRTPSTLNRMMATARGYLYAGDGPPGANGQYAMDQARQRAAELIDLTNTYYHTEWVTFQRAVAELNPTPFKSYGELKKIE